MIERNINQEVFRQLSYIAGNEQYMKKTLLFLVSLTKHDVQETYHGPVYAALMGRLSDFQEYEQGWDDEDALPLNKTVVRNFKMLISSCSDTELEDWTIFPETNGTLLLQLKNGNAAINIGNELYSYFSKQGGSITGEDNLSFNTENVKNLMRQLAA